MFGCAVWLPAIVTWPLYYGGTGGSDAYYGQNIT